MNLALVHKREWTYSAYGAAYFKGKSSERQLKGEAGSTRP